MILHRIPFVQAARCAVQAIVAALALCSPLSAADPIRDLQSAAIASGKAAWGHWGIEPDKYSSWKSHSNRLIPVYTFGVSLKSVAGPHSVYRDPARLAQLYGYLPQESVNPRAEYFDQTAVYQLQQAAVAAGKRYIILFIFDGMDWQTTWAAAIFQSRKVGYREGRGTGLAIQDYRGALTDFGFIVTSPQNGGTAPDVDAQIVKSSGMLMGGYDAALGGTEPWSKPLDAQYLFAQNRERSHAVTDSASSATSMTAGIKTYNGAINVDAQGRQVRTMAHALAEQGFAVGFVTNVQISHATPAAAYANNVSRGDYQDLTRDLVGLPSISHRTTALAGVDVLLGAGWGEESLMDENQGMNYAPGNRYIATEDFERIDAEHGGRYQVVQRTPGKRGKDVLADAVDAAIRHKRRLFGLFGTAQGHLPFRTADGGYDPVPGVSAAESYTQADISENPTLTEMTSAALTVLSQDEQGFWLMVEAGDVDWANHDNNLDNSIGAVLTGDEAFAAVTAWAEANDRWRDTAVIITADHGHYLVLEQPEALTGSPDNESGRRGDTETRRHGE